MRQRQNHKPLRQLSTQDKPVYWLLFGLVVLFVALGSTIETAAHGRHNSTSGTCLHAYKPTDNPFSALPFGSRPGLPGSETPDENELKEKIDSDEDDTGHKDRALDHRFARISFQSLDLKSRGILQNVVSVSLFVLHHSWKSHIC